MDQAHQWHIIEKKNHRKGMAVSMAIHALLLLFFLLFIVPIPKPDEQIQGVLIDFGNSRTGQGSDIRPVQDQITEETASQATESVEAAPPAETRPDQADEVVTQDVVEAPSISPEELAAQQQQAAEEAAAQAAAEAAAEAAAQEAAELAAQQQAAQDLKDQLDQAWGGDGSEGESDPGGDQGVQDGVDNGPHNDGTSSTGLGDSGIGHDLSGRKMVKKPTIDDASQKTGKVAIRVKVDRNGKVLSAEFSSQGSTTTDTYLVQLAKKAALEAKFNSAPNAQSEQIGLITFTFTFRVQ